MHYNIRQPYIDGSFRLPRVLVVSDRFPSINQPWIDTYLEQLLKQSFDLAIYSSNKSPEVYNGKVDELSLRSYLIDFNLKKISLFSSLIKDVLLHPCKLFQSSVKAWKISHKLTFKYQLSRIIIFFRLIRYRISERCFGDINVIHSHSEILAFEFLFLSIMRDLPLIYTFHGLLPKGVPALANNKRKALYGEAKRILVNTRFAMRQAESVGCPPEKIWILPQGLPVDEFTFSPLSCPGSEDVLHLLSVGRFHRDKGYGYSLLAAARLLKEGRNLAYNLVGVGPDKSRLKELIMRLGLSEHVTIHEALGPKDLQNLYKQSHIFILASIDNKYGEHVETQGVVLQEAQASGCIPVTTRVGGIPECVNHMEDAVLVPDKSSRAIADAVLYLLDRPEEWQSFQENGRRNVEQNFSADVIGARMAGILNEMAKTGGKQGIEPR